MEMAGPTITTGIGFIPFSKRIRCIRSVAGLLAVVSKGSWLVPLYKVRQFFPVDPCARSSVRLRVPPRTGLIELREYAGERTAFVWQDSVRHDAIGGTIRHPGSEGKAAA